MADTGCIAVDCNKINCRGFDMILKQINKYYNNDITVIEIKYIPVVAKF
jgi:hypothetical protein